MDFDFGERLFGKVWQRRRREQAARTSEDRAHFRMAAPRLQAIASMVAERSLLVREAEGVGGVRGRVLLLPASRHHAEAAGLSQDRWILLRVVLGSRMIAAEQTASAASEDPLAESIHYLVSMQQLAEHACQEYPRFAEDYRHALAAELEARPDDLGMSPQAQLLEAAKMRLLSGCDLGEDVSTFLRRAHSLSTKGADSPPIALWGDALQGAQRAEADRLEATAKALEQQAVAAGATEIAAPPKDHVERMVLEQDKTKDGTPEHVFEKIQTLEEFQGGRRRPDGEDDLADHEDALSELDLRQVVRGGPEAHSLYQADLGNGVGIPDVQGLLPEDRAVHYDEWHATKGAYRREWTAVYPAVATPRAPGWGQETCRRRRRQIDGLARRLQQERQCRERRNRQLDGPELDLAAVLEAKARLAAGQAASNRLYWSRRPRQRDQRTTLLLDISLSSDGWVENRRVLDIVREAALVLGEVTESLHDRLQILAFASNTRRLNRVWTVKDWQDDWHQVRDRLGALRPQGYTRIGPALRHATAGLASQSARHKLLLLLTDGKPTDFDRYEGSYGRSDVQQAVREAKQKKILVHALGFDPRAAGQLGSMFGTGAWGLVRHPETMPQAIVEAYRRFA